MKLSVKHLLSAVLFIALSCSVPGICEETGPSPCVPGHQELEAKAESGENLGTYLAAIFRDHISKVDGDRCPSLPSCSSYSGMAFKKHGFFVGWVMTVDRLIHEADEGSVSPAVYHHGRFKVLDPVENNDFWWYCGDGSKQK